MSFKIRTKLIIAFFGIIFPFLLIVGLISIYNLNIIYKGIHEVENISVEMHSVMNLELALDRALMPGNDYIITGEKRYIDDFNRVSTDVEESFKEIEVILTRMEEKDAVKKEMEILKDARVAWQNIKDISHKIFAITDPVGNRDAARPMEGMDYKWAGPVIERLKRWQGIDNEEYRKAHEGSERAWRQAWIIMVAGSVMLVALGVSFAMFYSRIFVRPIEELHNCADAIAGGDFKTRLDIRTGDEIEQLSNAMNKMAEKLDSFYGTLEEQVREKTEEIRESEAKKGAIIQAIPDLLFILSRDGTFKDYIPSKDVVLYVPPAEFVGRKMREVLPEDLSNQAMYYMEQAFLSRKVQPFEYSLPIKGVIRDYEARIVVSGEDEALILCRDITERKEAEERLRVSEEMYRSLFDNMLNGFAYCRMLFESGQPQDFIYLSVNHSFEALTGLKGVVGKKVTEVVPGIREADPGLFEIYGRVALSGKPERFEMYVESLRMWFWISVYSPRKEHFVAVFDVITERKNAEAALKESEERFRTITTTAGDAIIGLEAPGMINFWNRKAEEIFGYPADEVTGMDMHDLIVPERYRGKAREGMKGFFQTGAGPVVGKTIELTALRRDGTEFSIALSISAMKIQEKWQATGIIRDITERKKAEEELAKHVDELERYVKATVQREFRIKELRDRVEELEKRLKG